MMWTLRKANGDVELLDVQNGRVYTMGEHKEVLVILSDNGGWATKVADNRFLANVAIREAPFNSSLIQRILTEDWYGLYSDVLYSYPFMDYSGIVLPKEEKIVARIERVPVGAKFEIEVGVDGRETINIIEGKIIYY